MIKHILAAVNDHEALARVGDVISLGVVLGALSGLITGLAALLTVIWTGIRIFETDTVQRWLTRKGNDEQG